MNGFRKTPIELRQEILLNHVVVEINAILNFEAEPRSYGWLLFLDLTADLTYSYALTRDSVSLYEKWYLIEQIKLDLEEFKKRHGLIN